MYEYTDEIIRYLDERFIVAFDRLKRRLAKIDEISAILTAVNSTYTEIDKLTRFMLLKTAKEAYRKAGGSDGIDELWLLEFLRGYSPVTKYSYEREVDRKRSRLFEALAATGKSPKEIKTALRLWSQMAGEYAVEVTDAAVLQAYRELMIRRVRWITEIDERRCSVCASRHNRIYSIDNVPEKPHWGCRCVLIPVKN